MRRGSMVRLAAAAGALALAAGCTGRAGHAVQPSGTVRLVLDTARFASPEVVADHLEVPWGIAFLPDGSALVSERESARILRVRRGAEPREGARMPGVEPVGEGGLLGLALEPDDGIPADNPFPGSPVFTLGHRNVEGIAWDAAGRMFASEFGQSRFDEVNRIQAGRNYGWPDFEGGGAGDRFTDPLLTWRTSEASPSGVAIQGGVLYVAALHGERLWAVPLDPRDGVGRPSALLTGRYGRLRTVAVAPDGALWVMTSNRDGRGHAGPDDD